MFSRRSDSTHTTTETVKGPSLARGPAWIVGTVLAVFGLLMLFKAPGTPLSTGGFPDGVATGDSFLGFEVNAWTAWMTIAAGVFVLIGAAQHLAARTFSLIAGLALGAMSVIALFDGDDVLGLAAANGWDALGWGIASAVLLVTALLPRIEREREVDATERHRIAERDRARIAAREDDTARRDVDRPADREQASVAEHGEPARTSTSDAVSYGDRHRAADGSVPSASSETPGGTRSEPLRRTYQAPAQTETERDAEFEQTEHQGSRKRAGLFHRH